MKKGRFTEEQIAYALKQVETGMPVAEVRSADKWMISVRDGSLRYADA